MLNSTARLDVALRAAGIPIDGVSGSEGSVRVDYQASATAPQRTQGDAIVAAFDWSAAADDTFSARQAKTTAGSIFDAGALKSADAQGRALIALVLLILDEFNAHSTQTTNMLAAIAAAASLADLKTRMALVNNIPQRTQAQLIAAIKTKISGTAE